MPDEQKATRRLALPINFTSVLTIVFVFMAAMTAAYIWGVMSGRHYVQDQQLPELAEEKVEKKADTARNQGTERILQAQELEFANVLRGEKTSKPVPEKKSVASGKENGISPQPGAEKPESSTSEAQNPAEKATPEGPKPAETGNAAPPPVPVVDEGLYFDYVFQLAAFHNEQAADNLRERLEGRGLRTRLERKGRTYIVLAVLRGTASRAAEVGEIAKELRLGEPLLRSKREAGRR